MNATRQRTWYGLYGPDDVLVGVYAARAKAEDAAPGSDWTVYEVKITETGRIERDITRILGHAVGADTSPCLLGKPCLTTITPSSVQGTPVSGNCYVLQAYLVRKGKDNSGCQL